MGKTVVFITGAALLPQLYYLTAGGHFTRVDYQKTVFIKNGTSKSMYSQNCCYIFLSVAFKL
jgi:hypothetical protein